MMYHLDRAAEIYCEWGEQGIDVLREHVDVFVIVDVLSFSTCVDIAVAQGASVYPHAYKNDSALEYAESIGALCAKSTRSKTELSLSSYSLLSIEDGTKLVLPSPNGSHLSRLTGGKPTYCGSIRNASAVARAAMRTGSRIGVIPAGERWPDNSTRFALEDWLGAGAVIASMGGRRSAEANAAAATFVSCGDIPASVRNSSSGRELIERGYPEDVELAGVLNASITAPRLVEDAYMNEQL